MAGSATAALRLLVTATAVALLAGACSRHQGPTAVGPIDPVVLELVAPVGGESLRASDRLQERLFRADHDRVRRCLEELGYHDLPSFVYYPGRFFDFPDAQDLRDHAFHHYVDPPPPEVSDDGPRRGDQFDRDALRCDEQARSAGPAERIRRLKMESWMPISSEIRTRPQELELWRTAADCLVDRGYPRSGFDSEDTWFSAEQLYVEAGQTDAEKARRERKAANDYVDCVEPVWTARTKAAKAARERWVEQHDEELRSLSRRLRDLG